MLPNNAKKHIYSHSIGGAQHPTINTSVSDSTHGSLDGAITRACIIQADSFSFSRKHVAMSWLFGLNKGQNVPDVPPQFPGLPPPPTPPGDSGSGKDKDQGQSGTSKMEAYRFDSAALERAAKAAKELEKSREYPSI